MNINSELAGLEAVTGLKVRPDIQSAKDGENYITFTYATESPEIAADDQVEADTAILYVSLYTELTFDHMALKDTIRDYLEALDECVVSEIRTALDEYHAANNDLKYKRQTTFEVQITRWR
jgi:hypothetical protein